jgi:hypothetical protein
MIDKKIQKMINVKKSKIIFRNIFFAFVIIFCFLIFFEKYIGSDLFLKHKTENLGRRLHWNEIYERIPLYILLALIFCYFVFIVTY